MSVHKTIGYASKTKAFLVGYTIAKVVETQSWCGRVGSKLNLARKSLINLRRGRRSSIPNLSRMVGGIEALIPSTTSLATDIERSRIERASSLSSLPPSSRNRLSGPVGSYEVLNRSTMQQISRKEIRGRKLLTVRAEVRDWRKCYRRTRRDG